MVDQQILIVDDEQRTLMFLRESLIVAGLNANFTCVLSAEEALKAFAQRTFDVVILDIRMAGMDGLQLLERLREMYPGVRVIVVSGYQDAEIEARTRKLGVYGFFRKPFAFDEFTGAVASALHDAAKGAGRAHPPLSGWNTQFVQRQLTALMRDTGAQCVLLTNGGTVVARVGDANGFQDVVPAPVTSQESVFNFAYHQGKTHDIYSADVGNGMRLSLVFDRNQPSSRIGLVLQYTRRTVQELAAAFGHPGSVTGPPEKSA
jgi:CheY-like chemotaxis protein